MLFPLLPLQASLTSTSKVVILKHPKWCAWEMARVDGRLCCCSCDYVVSSRRSDVVSSRRSDAENKAVLDAFKMGLIEILSQAGMLNEGFDHPGISVVTFMRYVM